MTAFHQKDLISEVISMAWDDDISFDSIRRHTDMSEGEVIIVMCARLKPKSFKIWRQRVSGRKSKHEKKIMLREQE